MKTLLTLLISFFSFAATAQIPEPAMLWLREYGGNGDDQVEPFVTKTQDKGFISCINSNSAYGTGNIDSFCSMSDSRNIFIKYNSDAGVVEWTKCFTDGHIYMYPIDSGNFIFGGQGYGAAWEFFIEKTDSVGDNFWRKTYGGEAASALLRGMMPTNDGGYIMFGIVYYTDTDFTTHYGMYGADMGVLKVDSNGNKVWSKVIGGTGDDEAAAIVPAPGAGCYIVGYTTSGNYDCTGNHGGSDAYVARLDSNGNILWHNDLGGSNNDGGGGTNAYPDGNGGVIIATISGSDDGDVSHQIDTGGFDIWAIDVDSNNHILWNNCYGGGGMKFQMLFAKQWMAVYG